jgi:hypothetical protein
MAAVDQSVGGERRVVVDSLRGSVATNHLHAAPYFATKMVKNALPGCSQGVATQRIRNHSPFTGLELDQFRTRRYGVRLDVIAG